MILKEKKGREFLVIDWNKCTEKFLKLLPTDNFIQFEHVSVERIEGKIQRSIRKIKNKLTEQEYRGLYQTGSSLEKFYSTAKQIKGRNDRFIWPILLSDGISLRPVFSNAGTASYQLVKYLVKLLSWLIKYTVNSIKEFIDMIKNATIWSACEIISFDVFSLFSMVSLDYTIYLTLKRIYGNREFQSKN